MQIKGSLEKTEKLIAFISNRVFFMESVLFYIYAAQTRMNGFKKKN